MSRAEQSRATTLPGMPWCTATTTTTTSTLTTTTAISSYNNNDGNKHLQQQAPSKRRFVNAPRKWQTSRRRPKWSWSWSWGWKRSCSSSWSCNILSLHQCGAITNSLCIRRGWQPGCNGFKLACHACKLSQVEENSTAMATAIAIATSFDCGKRKLMTWLAGEWIQVGKGYEQTAIVVVVVVDAAVADKLQSYCRYIATLCQ